MTVNQTRHRLPAGLLPTQRLLALRVDAIRAALRRQPFAVWATFTYLFFEYVRPQTIYPAIDILPWAQIALLSALFGMMSQTVRTRRWTIVDSWMLLFTVVLLASSAFASNPRRSFDSLDLYVSWVLVYLFLSSNINNLERFLLLLLSWSLWNLKMTLHAFRSWAAIGFEFRNWGVTGAPGWFQNSGEFGIQTTIILPIYLYLALALRPYVRRPIFLVLLVLPITALTGAVASSSRGALLGMAAIGIWLLARSKYKVRGLAGLTVALTVVWLILPTEQKSRFAMAGEDESSVTRLTYWKRGMQLANEHPLLGIGYKNWLEVYYQRFGYTLDPGRRVELPHNIFVEAGSELGYLGLLALLGLLASNFFLNSRTRALARRLGEHGRFSAHIATGLDGAMIGYVITGSFVTVLYYPFQWINLAMTVALYQSTWRAVAALERSEIRPLMPLEKPSISTSIQTVS